MTAIASERPALLRGAIAAGLLGLAVLVGLIVAVQPFAGLAVVGLLALIGLAFLAPVTHLTLLLIATVLVPYGIQNNLSPGGAGLLPSDLLLLTGLLRAAIVLLREPLDRRRMLALALLVGFLAIVALQALHGLDSGRPASQVGYELRVLIGFATLAISMPIMADPGGPRRLAVALMTIGLLLGLWGLAQWSLGLKEIGESGIGVREGIHFASAGKGQLQGGLYGYPIAVVMAFAALVSGRLSTVSGRVVLAAILVTNFVSLILTYERTFWVTTLLGMGFVVLKSARGRRVRTVASAIVTAAVLLGALAAIAPNDFTAARERLLSLDQYSSDNSVRTRVVETNHVIASIEKSPWLGSGLGATIFWGQPWNEVPPEATWYSHNGYLWVIWKGGIVAGLILFVLLLWATFCRPPPRERRLAGVLRVGAQAALFVMLLASFTFPTFNGLEITAAMGVLAAICLSSPPQIRAGTRTA